MCVESKGSHQLHNEFTKSCPLPPPIPDSGLNCAICSSCLVETLFLCPSSFPCLCKQDSTAFVNSTQHSHHEVDFNITCQLNFPLFAFPPLPSIYLILPILHTPPMLSHFSYFVSSIFFLGASCFFASASNTRT